MSWLNEMRRAVADEVRAALADGDPVRVIVDVRDASQVPAVLVDVPTVMFPSATGRKPEVQIPLQVLAPAPGNADAVEWQLDVVGRLAEQLRPPPEAFRPGMYRMGQVDLPTFTATVIRHTLLC